MSESIPKAGAHTIWGNGVLGLSLSGPHGAPGETVVHVTEDGTVETNYDEGVCISQWVGGA